MKTINDLIAANQARTYTHQPAVMGTREGQTEWPERTLTLLTKSTPSKPRGRMNAGMKKKTRRKTSKKGPPKADTITVRIEPKAKFGLVLLARSQKRTVSAVVQNAVEAALTKDSSDNEH